MSMCQQIPDDIMMMPSDISEKNTSQNAINQNLAQ